MCEYPSQPGSPGLAKLGPFDSGAYTPVLFQFALGAFHIDILPGRELFADLIAS
jgi:hypothetical protein